MVPRVTKITHLADISVLRKWEALFRGLRLFIWGNPVVILCGQMKPCVAYILCSIHYFLETSLFYSILNGVLVFKLSVVHCCTRATISIQGQLYRYSYHQISVTIHRRIEHSTIKNTKIKHVYSVAQVYVILWQNYLVPIFVSYRSPCLLKWFFVWSPDQNNSRLQPLIWIISPWLLTNEWGCCQVFVLSFKPIFACMKRTMSTCFVAALRTKCRPH